MPIKAICEKLHVCLIVHIDYLCWVERNLKKDTVTIDKNVASMSVVEENTSSNDQEMAISQKIDILIDVVENMGNQIKRQDECLWKQEERSSLSDLSAVLLLGISWPQS